jgi:exopolysaccharide biosynthesis predicted pyruvyltransferase EpsI
VLDDNLVARLRAEVREALSRSLNGASACALVGFPLHANAGDSAIWAGSVQLLSELGIRRSYSCGRWDYNPVALRRYLPKGAPILLLGGGNFGDLWPEEQAFREQVIRDFPDRRVVQLPQSVHFDSPQAVERSRQVLGAHSDVTVLVRDQPSLEFCRKAYDVTVELVPDMAFGLRPASAPAPRQDRLLLLRSDHERVDGAASAPDAADWLGHDRRGYALRLAVSQLARLQRRTPYLANGPRASGLLDMLSRGEVARGLACLHQGRVVVTDRLHAHILSLLSGRPHVILNNKQGKVFNFDQAWTLESASTHRATTLGEALEIAKTL